MCRYCYSDRYCSVFYLFLGIFPIFSKKLYSKPKAAAVTWA